MGIMKKRWLSILSISVIALGALVFNRYNAFEFKQHVSNSYSFSPVTIEVKKSNILYGLNVNEHRVIEDKVKKNQFLADILKQYNVPVKLINQVSAIPRNVFDVRKVAANKKYTLICKPDSLNTAKVFVYEPNPIDYIVFTFEDSLWVDVCQRDVVVEEKSVSGMIESSLSQTIEQMGISHELTNKFVDIFAWQVDFQRLQKGDVFKLVYEEMQVEGRPIGIRNINGIYFEHFGSGYYAIPFDQGEGKDYFDDQGKSLRKALFCGFKK